MKDRGNEKLEKQEKNWVHVVPLEPRKENVSKSRMLLRISGHYCLMLLRGQER